MKWQRLTRAISFDSDDFLDQELISYHLVLVLFVLLLLLHLLHLLLLWATSSIKPKAASFQIGSG